MDADLRLLSLKSEMVRQESIHSAFQLPGSARQPMESIAQMRVRGHPLWNEEVTEAVARHLEVEVRGVENRLHPGTSGRV
jgi:hypothetical protein